MHDLYPELVPFESGYLPELDGQLIFYEVSGNPEGIPALILHGGPGSGSSKTSRRYFDPGAFKIIQFDQRNCGRSLPHASEAHIDLSHNTLSAMLTDIERLRVHLEIEKWLVLGGSWGATLALAYSQRYPQQVTSLVLNSVATTTPREINWITRGVGVFFPREWQDFQNHFGPDAGEDDLVGAYYALLISDDPAIHQPAADAWCRWEMAIVNVTSSHQPHPRWSDPKFRLCFARLVTHVWHHKAWLDDNQLINSMGTIAHIPGRLIHGRLDYSSPLITAWNLHQNWPNSVMQIIETAGHDTRDLEMTRAIMSAITDITRT